MKLVKGNNGNERFTAAEKICLKDMVRKLDERVKCVENCDMNQNSCKIEAILKLLVSTCFRLHVSNHFSIELYLIQKKEQQTNTFFC